MLNLFLAPFQFPFMVNAIAVSIVVAIPCALLSVFLVLKGWALMGDAMSHAVFPGVVLAYIIGIPFAIGAFIAGLLCAWRDAAASATSASTLTGIGCAYFAASACRSRRD